MYRTAVIDSSTLINFSNIKLKEPSLFFSYLRNIFAIVYFPSEVINEFSKGVGKEPQREYIISKVKPENTFYTYCTSYDTLVLELFRGVKGVDKGELEAYAQYKKVNAHFLVSDDNRFINAIKYLDSGVKIYTSLHIICWLDLAKLIPNWYSLVKQLHLIRPFESKNLREAYIRVAKDLGLQVAKSIINNKCSLKKIL